MTQKPDTSTPAPPRLLNILVVEDSPYDAELLLQELRRAGLNVHMDVAKTAVEVVAFLLGGSYDVVLSDFNLRGWTGLDALQLLRERRPDLPFILVTGSLGDEKTAECIKLGAADFVLKDRLNRLPHAITRALEEKRLREERLASEEALQRLERQNALILHAAGEGIFGVDVQGKTTFVNPEAAKLLGYAPQELVGQLQHAIIHHTRPDGTPYPRQECPIYAAFTDGQVRSISDEVFWRKDGTSFPVEYASTPVLDDGRRPSGAVVVFRDITERRSLEQQFRQAQKMEAVGRLAGGVAHDFNNLMGVVLGYSELLLESLPASDPARHKIEQIKDAAQRATGVTRQLLAFSRKQALEPQILNLSDVVSGMKDILQRLLGEDIELVFPLDPDVKAVKADQGQLEQVIMNLAVNARDAMPGGGKLVIETQNVFLDEEYSRRHVGSQHGSFVMLAVSDTGIGMDEETRSHIFEPFFTTKAKGKGTGLGLATVYGIVKQSDGFIWVYSELGRGTTFKVYLPQTQEQGLSARAAEAAEDLSRGTETVLVVEDEKMLREVTCEFLHTSGYHILTAASSADALRLAQTYPGPIELLVTDVVMPGMGGRELAEHIFRSRPGMKVLYVSGYTDEAILQNGILEGDAEFLQKPFTRSSLTRKVRKVLDGKVAGGG